MRLRPTPIRYTLSALAFVGLAAGAVIASDPGPNGRVLPSELKKILWAKACDLADGSYDVDCTTNSDPTRCRFSRSNGDKFEPALSDYTRSYFTARGGGTYTVLEPGLREAKLLGDQTDDNDYAGLLFRLVSGLELRIGAPDADLFHINPAAVAWAQRELLPTTDEPMCGATAGEVYTANFQRTVRASALAYEYLKRGGHLTKVNLARLEKERGERSGGYWRMCETLDKGPLGKDFPANVLRDECQFWLRRGASGSAGELAALVGVVLERFDPTFFKAHAKTFALKPIPKPPVQLN